MLKQVDLCSFLHGDDIILIPMFDEYESVSLKATQVGCPNSHGDSLLSDDMVSNGLVKKTYPLVN